MVLSLPKTMKGLRLKCQILFYRFKQERSTSSCAFHSTTYTGNWQHKFILLILHLPLSSYENTWRNVGPLKLSSLKDQRIRVNFNAQSSHKNCGGLYDVRLVHTTDKFKTENKSVDSLIEPTRVQY